jgi:hypothetical protein
MYMKRLIGICLFALLGLSLASAAEAELWLVRSLTQRMCVSR